MAVYDLEEQEQLDEIKTWWKRYGDMVTWILLAAAVALAGWQGWNWYQRNQTSQASAIFGGLQQAAAKGDAKRVRELAGELIEKYSGTAQADLAALTSAKVQVDAGDIKTAKAQLGWAAANARDDGLRDLARLRLAAILVDEGAYDEALKQLAAEPAAPFGPRFDEVKGDALALQGKAADARTAYESAIRKLEALQKDELLKKDELSEGRAYKEMLQSKLDLLGLAAAGAAK